MRFIGPVSNLLNRNVGDVGIGICGFILLKIPLVVMGDSFETLLCNHNSSVTPMCHADECCGKT